MSAPYGGRINRVLVEVGDHVTSNRVVLELIEDEWLDLYAEVSATTAAALTAGQRLAVSVGETEHEGELVALQPDPDPDTFTYPLRVRLRGEGLLSGMLASVHLPLAPKVDALVVPLSAMLHEEGKSYVFVVKDKRLERRSVITGVRADGVQVVRAGLVLDETLVARDVASLSHGQDVLLIQPEQASLQ